MTQPIQVTLSELRTTLDMKTLLESPGPFELTVSAGGGRPMTVAFIVPGWIYIAHREELIELISSFAGEQSDVIKRRDQGGVSAEIEGEIIPE